jgi:predicted RNA-binding Zn-ribbon protein involved in translation (DUF1610 family)
MTQTSQKMICTDCGAEMNHHAMKIDYTVADGAVQEVHTCPECGQSEMRRAE